MWMWLSWYKGARHIYGNKLHRYKYLKGKTIGSCLKSSTWLSLPSPILTGSCHKSKCMSRGENSNSKTAALVTVFCNLVSFSVQVWKAWSAPPQPPPWTPTSTNSWLTYSRDSAVSGSCWRPEEHSSSGQNTIFLHLFLIPQLMIRTSSF